MDWTRLTKGGLDSIDKRWTGDVTICHIVNFPVNSNTTGTITPMFSSYDWMKPNLKQKAGTAREKWLVRKDWGKLRGVKSLFLCENMLEK